MKIKILAVVIFIFPFFANAATFVSGDISTNTTWTKAESPYIISDHSFINVSVGTTLTIEPGVVVKFGNRSRLNIYGSLKAVGIASDKIYFTSLINDAIGGDDNGDGNLTEPSPYDDWNIFLRSGSYDIEFENVGFSYSYDTVWASESEVSFVNVSFTDCFDAIGAYKSKIVINTVEVRDIDGSVVWGDNGKFEIESLNVDGVYGFYPPLDFFRGAEITIDNSKITNVGLARALRIDGSHATVTNSVFSGGLYSGIEIHDDFFKKIPSTLSITNSIIENFVDNGLYIYSSKVDISKTKISSNRHGIRINDWSGHSRSEVAVSQSSIVDNSDYGIYTNGLNSVDVRNNWWGDSSGPFHQTLNSSGLGNAVFGNVLFDPWLASDPTAEKRIDPVLIIPGILGSAEKDGVWLIDPIFHTYDDLIATLVANGYVEGQDLFTFPYDWRFSNILTAVALKNKIAEVKNICQCDKVDLVAHSMGGLAARQYIQSPQYADDVDQLIFLGTPHLGAPKAYYSWEGATVPPNDPVYSVIKFMLWSEAFKLDQSLFDYIHQSVFSIRELLPIYDYLTLKDSGIVEKYPNGYPANSFLENLSAGTDELLNSGVEIINIVGNTGNSTIISIEVASSTEPNLWEHGKPEIVSYGGGDETVPITSAILTFSDSYVFDSRHNKLPTIAEGIVYKELTTKDATTLVDNWDLINLKLLLIKILSPADIQVIAPDGSIVGKDFATGQEINQIPGAFYSGFQTDNEYVTIPNPQPGDYIVKTIGTGSGSYIVATSLISNTGSVEKETIGTTKPDFVAQVEVSVSGDDSLEILPPDVQAITPDFVIADIQLAYDNGWLKDKKIRDKLIKEIKAMIKVEKKIEKIETKVKEKNIEKKIEKLEVKVDKVLAKALKTELKLYNEGKILTDEGFNLIKNDIELLMLIY